VSDSVETQIVNMEFNNKQFESGVKTSTTTLGKFKESLKFDGKGLNLGSIDTQKFDSNVKGVAKTVSTVTARIRLLHAAALVAFGTVVRQAVYAGERVLSAFTIDPIKAGFQNYETKINAVQTILANTSDQGTKLKDVTKSLNELNTYANKTVYNFSEMAKNIGTFTAAGVDLKTSTASIKGIANLAALSGSTSQQASTAMYQLSQAIAAGQVHLQDWNSVVNAGIGGAVFQRNLINTALATGTLDKNQVHLGKTMADTTVNGLAFRQSLTPPPGGTSWLTSGVLTKSLGTFTGDMTKAQLAAQGFNKEQIKTILQQGKLATNAATKIKTFSQLMQALKEEVATAWASVFESIFGNINQAKAFFSPLHTALENALTTPVYALANTLKGFRKLGGFGELMQGFKNIGTTISNLVSPFTTFFKTLFPGGAGGQAGKGLYGLAKGFEVVTGWMAKASAGMKILDPVMKGIALVIRAFFGDIAKLVGFLRAFDLAGVLKQAFAPAASMAHDMILNGRDIAANLIEGLAQGLSGSTAFANIAAFAEGIIQQIKDVLGIRSPAKSMIPIGINIVQGIVQGIQSAASFLITGLQKLFTGVGQFIKAVFTNINWGDVTKVINEGIFIALSLAFRNFIKSFTGTVGAFKETLDKAGGVIDQLSSNLKTMQQKVKSEIIRNIAISVGILAVSALLLSTVNGKKLAVSLGAIAGMMTALLGVMYALGGGGKGKHIDSKAVGRQTATMLAMSTALVGFATGVLIFTGAVALMGQLKTSTIERGLAGVTGAIAVITAATAVLGKTGGGKTMIAAATALIIMSVGLTAFAGVMKLYSTIDWKTLVRGGGSAAAVIAALGLAMRGFGKGAFAGSAALVVASAGLVVMAKALQMMSKIGVGNMIKVIIAIDVLLASISAAANSMSAAEGGAGSMLVMAGAIIVLAEALKIISQIPLGGLIKALAGIAAALIILGGASAILSPLTPVIAAFGTALVLIGASIFLAGTGILAFATAMGILAVVGPAAFAAMQQGLDQFLKDLPRIGRAFGGFILSILQGFVDAAQPLAKAIGKLMTIIIRVIVNQIPEIRKLAEKLINALLDVIGNSAVHAGKVMVRVILQMLSAVDKAVPKFINRGTNIVINIIEGLGRAEARIVNAMGRTVLSFLRALDKAIKKYEGPIIAEGRQIASDLVAGLVKGLGAQAALSAVGNAAAGLANKAKDALGKVWKVLSPSKVARELGGYFAEGAALGITDNAHMASIAAEDVGRKSANALKLALRNSRASVNDLIDISPKVTPVLDLSKMANAHSSISAKMGSHSIKADVSRRQARDVSAHESARYGSGPHSGGDTYEFVQHIHSPKPVNKVEVYRGTKSQIALFKEVTSRR
jgi:hypothetical protein